MRRLRQRGFDLRKFDTHAVTVNFVRRYGLLTSHPDVVNLECNMSCSSCFTECYVALWEDDYPDANEAEIEALRRARQSFDFDCADHVARSVMSA